jgi:hypothetical protein
MLKADMEIHYFQPKIYLLERLKSFEGASYRSRT